jgi:hypothetical protein
VPLEQAERYRTVQLPVMSHRDRMLVALYSSFKAPKVAGVVWFLIGLLLLFGGVWGAIVQPGLIPWFLIGGGLLMAVTGLLLRQGIA